MSAISINNNILATKSANYLTDHYSRLAVSTQRLSSGLRINSAADDAAGLAIRELMRADIAALHQGVRNANDAISMLQTFDGALSVIDEKLIRMKELAEQASTGTYDSTQRLMIDSEFQAMGAEINRIARATDFNGVKLINGEFETPATTVVGPDGRTYDVSATGGFVNAQFGANVTQGDWDTSGVQDPSKLAANTTITISNNSVMKLGDKYLMVNPASGSTLPNNTTLSISFTPGAPITDPTGGWTASVGGAPVFASGNAASVSFSFGGATYQFLVTDASGNVSALTSGVGITNWTSPATTPSFTSNIGTVAANMNGNTLEMSIDLGNGNIISNSWTITTGNQQAISSATATLKVVDTTDIPDDETEGIPDNVVKIHFGTMNDSAEDYYYINKFDATLKGLGLDGVNIQTQERAQGALVQVNDAIVEKDKIRAYYGAMQNRLENTVSNLKVQAENLQTSESRISDADIAKEMTEFVRNQVLTNSAVAMLAQANSLPQMVMRLIGG